MLGSVFTIICGVILYIITRALVDYMLEQRKLIGEICLTAIKARKIITIHDGDQKDNIKEEISNKFKEIGELLILNINMIPYYRFFEIIKLVRNKRKLLDAVEELNKLSINFRPLNKIEWVQFYVTLKNLSSISNFDYDIIRNYGIKQGKNGEYIEVE